MKFLCHSHWDSLPQGTQAVFEHAQQQSMFLTRAWFENLQATTLGGGESVLLACVVEDEQLLALLPLVTGEEDHWRALSHSYGSLYTPLLAPQGCDREAVLACLAHGLYGLPFRGLRLGPLQIDSPDIEALRRQMAQAGFSVHPGFGFYNWVHRLQGQSFDDYMAGRPARLRNTIARKQRKLEREHRMQMQLYQGTQVPAAMHHYHAVYGASWKANEQFTTLLDGLVERFSVAGWSRLGVLSIDDRPAAAQLWFVVGRRAHIFRLAYDQAWKAWSPGSILTRYLVQQVIDHDKVGEIDFLTGNEAYKQDWMSQRRERWVLAFGKTDKGRDSAGAGLLGKIKNLLQS